MKDTHHFLDGTDPVCSLDAPRVSSASILGSEWMDRHSIKSFGVGARFHFGLSKTELGRRRARLPASPPAEKANARQDQSRQSSADDGAGNIRYGAKQPVHLAIDAIGEEEGVEASPVTAPGPEAEEPKAARHVIAYINRDCALEHSGCRVEGINLASHKAEIADQ